MRNNKKGRGEKKEIVGGGNTCMVAGKLISSTKPNKDPGR